MIATDNRTEEEILADRKERQKDHKFMTTEEAQAWNAARVQRPLSDSHWMTKRAKEEQKLRDIAEEIHKIYVGRLSKATAWKGLASKLRDRVAVLEEQLERAGLEPRPKR